MFGLVRPSTSLARREPAGTAQRRDPWTEVARLHQEMDDLAPGFFGYTPLSRMLNEAPAAALPVELYEDEKQFTLRAHLPGVPREDINLEVTAARVALWGERRTPTP